MSKQAHYTQDEGHITAHFGQGTRGKYAELESIIKRYVPRNEDGYVRQAEALVALEKLLMFAAADAESMVRQAWQDTPPVVPAPLMPRPLYIGDYSPREG